MEFLGSLHPKIIHFPIALFIVYTFLEASGFLLKKEVFTKAAFIVLILGMIGAFAAVLTGHQAEEVWKNWNTISKPMLEEHETFATITLWYFFGLLILRTFYVINVEIKNKFREHTKKMLLGFVILALAGCFFIYKTGEYGGKMVYKQGVGVSIEQQGNPINLEDED